MLDNHKLQKLPKVAVIMPTLRCNITCPHCLLSCSPRSGDTATSEQLQKWTVEFIDLGFAPICITGGEVFLYPNLVNTISKICAERSTPLVIQTNGFWASTSQKAQKMLDRITYVTQLGFSIDKAHMQFINPKTIEYGISAAYARGISNISLSISYQDVAEAKEIIRNFKRLFPKLTIDSWPITPIGRAQDNPELNCTYDVYSWDFLSRSCEAQSKFTPIVYPNGDVHLCYHLLMCLGRDDPFQVGNLCAQSLKAILDNVEDPLFAFILAYGGGSIGYLLEEIAPELVLRQYQRNCQLCYEALSRKEVVAYLRELLSLPQLREKIEQAIALRSREAGRRETKQKTITACKGKNCFGKSANTHLKNYLSNRFIDSGKWESANLECVDCMKACKYGPNIKLSTSDEILHRVDKARIDEIILSF